MVAYSEAVDVADDVVLVGLDVELVVAFAAVAVDAVAPWSLGSVSRYCEDAARIRDDSAEPELHWPWRGSQFLEHPLEMRPYFPQHRVRSCIIVIIVKMNTTLDLLKETNQPPSKIWRVDS